MNAPITPTPPAVPTATATSPSSPAAPGNPAELTAPPGTALQIAQMLAAGKIDTTQARKLSKAGNISTLDVAQALNVLREAAEPRAPDLRTPEMKELDNALPVARPEDYTIANGGPDENGTMTPELKQGDTVGSRF